MAVPDKNSLIGPTVTEAQFKTNLGAIVDFIKPIESQSPNYATTDLLTASRPLKNKSYAKALDTGRVWFWNKPEEAPDGNYWENTGLSELDQALSELKNTFGTASNLFDTTKIFNDSYINVANNSISSASGTALAIIAIRPNQKYKIYSTTYPSTAWGIWYSTIVKNGVVNKLEHTISSDGYIHFSIPGNTTEPLVLYLNIKIPSQNFDITNQLLVLEEDTSETEVTKISSSMIRDNLLVTDIDKALGLSRQSVNLLNTAIKLPNKYIRANDNKIRSTSGNSVDAIAFRLPAGTYYYFAPNATANHLVGSSQTVVYDTVVQLIVPVSTEFAGVKKFTITEECYVVFTTRISGVDILPDFRLSTSIDVKDGLITKIAGTEIYAQNGIGHHESIDDGLATTEKPGIYLSASNMAVRSSSSTKSRVVEVQPNKTYFIYSEFWDPLYFVCGFVDSLNPAILSVALTVNLNESGVQNVKSFTTPDDGIVRYFMFNTIIGTAMNIDSTFKFFKKSFSEINGFGLVDSYLRNRTRFSLDGKKWVAIGDSITERNFRTNLNYHDYIAQENDKLTVFNYGISGSGFFNRHDVASKITQTDVDIITIFLGTNDWGNQVTANRKQLGVFGDTGTTTISGCINTMLLGLINKFPLIPIALITPLPRATNYGLNAPDNDYGYNIKDLCDLLKQYAEHYSLPIFDLYSQSNLYPWQDASNRYYFTAPSNTEPDGLHPNDNGHKVIAGKLSPFIGEVIRSFI
ncbi:SGNH/GDSL hydrolase family protein [Acinetobacter baumannii]|uniref:SGNH/GDSL hydrolase family protein n=1 Tax=Acinetobacter baumannii TaxID=470 RepID=UPI00280E20EF|nr:SGNH/GDSL hydrolase family protein [Acinetobacter baumannii]MDQ8919204.1 SGNH/GDSL hydrolase family protein [Acinetobacter baumannii]MDQ8950157.1 SGNH/GDSL hydrolase family protein [Acinetobacter baumannii]MDQ8968098.1 SGNH/GDSL hydrolase family protein [Acinetobacter baumannii]MDQ8982018.1 SGNH/GDSL hydrolase family protein [Acinetobacter baumannii]MDQ8989524.1 SGNH/GDSL hydrolase family protein [Acinetobacter baumannii]